MPTTTTFANELKATNYASSPKSGSGYAATDLIQLYANDGTPNGKISRTDLMSCVKDSLGSLLNAAGADQSTSAAKVPTINSSGVLGSSTIANLASLLGATLTRVTDFTTPPDVGVIYIDGNITNAPFGISFGTVGFCIGGNYRTVFVPVFNSYGLRIYIRTTAMQNGHQTWSSDWHQFDLTQITS